MLRSRMVLTVYADTALEAVEQVIFSVSKYLDVSPSGIGDLIDTELEVTDSDLDNGKAYKVTAFVKVK